MWDRLEFDGFIGSVHFSAEDEIFFGKIEGVNDLVTFEGSTVNELKKVLSPQLKTIKTYTVKPIKNR